MPSNHKCQSCTLEFQAGWYFYPSFDTGYAARTLLVCGACGHQHAVEIALRSRGPEFIQRFAANLMGVPEASRLGVMAYLREHTHLGLEAATEVLSHLPHQLVTDLFEHQAMALVEEYADRGAVVEVAVVSESPNPQYGPIQRDRLLAYDVAQGDEERAWRELTVLGVCSDDAGAFEVALQACGRCQCVGQLLSSWPVERPCPVCGGRLEDRGFWVA